MIIIPRLFVIEWYFKNQTETESYGRTALNFFNYHALCKWTMACENGRGFFLSYYSLTW